MKKVLGLSLLTLMSTPALAEDYMGLSLGSPAAVNFVYKGDIGGLPLQVSGGFWGDRASGIELGYRFVENQSLFSSAQVLLGYSKIENSIDVAEDWTYVGLSATFSYKGLFIEPGVSVGSGDHSSPQFLLQAGYVWRF